MMDESVCWTKKRQQAARNFNHLNENPGTEAKSGKIKSSFGVFQQTARAFSDQTENALALFWRATLSDQVESSIQPDRMLL
jgi:hypothetical protein